MRLSLLAQRGYVVEGGEMMICGGAEFASVQCNAPEKARAEALRAGAQFVCLWVESIGVLMWEGRVQPGLHLLLRYLYCSLERQLLALGI